MYILLLSQDNITLSEYEAESLLELKEHTLKECILFANIASANLKKINRLAYTKKVCELLFECRTKELKEALLDYDYKKFYDTNFCLRIHNITGYEVFNESEYAIPLWRSLVRSKIAPKVDLNNPKTTFEIFISKNQAFVCRLLWTNDTDFESRQAHLRPALHPTSMHPKNARALVNIVDSDKIIDPFCGSGGILIEAGMMKLKFIGYDIDDEMLAKSKKNLDFYKISKKNYSLRIMDATKAKDLKNVVTDLPYGKSSKKSDEIKNLYANFIKNIIGRAVIVFPDFVDYKKILKNNLNKKLKIIKIIDYYVHKSLTRKIVVIDKK